MGHVVLLGDSIFDNARYVPDRLPVIEQVRRALPHGWRATLRAVDGHTTEGVPRQLQDLPADATHLVLSAGGNDALGESSLLGEVACTVGEALGLVQDVRTRFRRSYAALVQALAAVAKPAVVCTIDDAIPGLGPAAQAALAGFNMRPLQEGNGRPELLGLGEPYGSPAA